VLNDAINNIISWQSMLLVAEAGIKHQVSKSQGQTLSLTVDYSTHHHGRM